VHKCFDERAAGAAAFTFRRDRDRADFGKVQAVEMERATAENAPILFHDDKVANIFGQLGAAARQKRAGVGVGLDDGVDLVHVGKNGVASFYRYRIHENNYAE
ncbi:MAG TPA: hypothetical protein VLW83_17305, partial [Candidatus Acidoferrales bacterium]|nr:hypothetical protein [Candidatus Acidoferrales bacterium]